MPWSRLEVTLKYLLIMLALLLCAACTTRENAKAAIQADQAAKGIIKILESPEAKANIDAAMSKAVSLAYSVQTSLEPVILELSNGETIPVPTSVDVAVSNTPGFIIAAAQQSGRAIGEAISNNQQSQYAGLGITTSLGLVEILLGGTTLGGAVLAGIAAVKKISQYKTALVGTVAYAKEATSLDPADEVGLAGLKAKHMQIQESNGTKPLIDAALVTVKQS